MDIEVTIAEQQGSPPRVVQDKSAPIGRSPDAEPGYDCEFVGVEVAANDLRMQMTEAQFHQLAR